MLLQILSFFNLNDLKRQGLNNKWLFDYQIMNISSCFKKNSLCPLITNCFNKKISLNRIEETNNTQFGKQVQKKEKNKSFFY